jgi:dihydroorotase
VLLQGGLQPHAFCLPILKRERHREAVLGAAVSGNTRFFLGTDSAPHPKGAKVRVWHAAAAADYKVVM